MAEDGLLLIAARALANGPLGEQGARANPWQFVASAEAGLRGGAVPEAVKPELHSLVALAYARLGLATMAAAHLSAAGVDRAMALREYVAALPDDRITKAERVAVCDRNIGAMGNDPGLHLLLRGAVDDWRERVGGSAAFRTSAGVAVVRSQATVDGEWRLFVDDAALAASIGSTSLGNGPLYFDGAHTPLTISRVFQATQAAPFEQQTRLVFLAATAGEVLDALSLRDLSELLSSSRVGFMVGSDVPRRLAVHFNERIKYVLGLSIALPTLPDSPGRWPRGTVAERLTQAGREQVVRTRRSREAVENIYSEREVPWWRARYESASSGGAKLRALVMTTRNSTMVRHVAHDFAEACAGAGIDATVVIEPDDTSRLTPLAVTAEIERVEPDLIVLINNVRSQLTATLPANIPVMTWVQDAMTHLFDEATGRALGEFDFIVGHLHPELFEKFGFPRERSMYSPVLASEVKFHDAPVDARVRERFECDIAYASHQSETPEQFRDRWLAGPPVGSWVASVMPHLFPRVVEAARRADVRGAQLLPALREIAAESYRRGMGEEPTARALALVMHSLAEPLAERALRQQMVTWAADTCDRRGWKLHLYGAGWDAHPRFARYAKGILAHGEGLRAAYQCPKLHLHAGLGGVHHQRVMECALSGGCTLVRIKADEVRLLEWWAQNDLAEGADLTNFVPAFPDRDGYLLTPVADHWQSMMVHALCDRLGVAQQHDRRGWQAVHAEQLRRPWHERSGTPLPFEAAWLAGDLSESGFWSEESFVRAATAVVESAERRASLASWQRNATLKHFSLSIVIARMLEMLRGSFESKTILTSAAGG